MPRGYISGRPDVSYWEDQIRKGTAFRNEVSFRSSWDKWRKFYRGRWRAGIQPNNLFFKLERSIVPRVYFRDPQVSITSLQAGMENVIFGHLMTKIVNQLLRMMKTKKQMKRSSSNTFKFGTGAIKMGFGAEFSPTANIGFNTAAPLSKRSNELLEYNSTIRANMPWLMSTHPGDIVVASGLDDFDNARWIGHWFTRPTEDVMADPRYEAKATKNIKSTDGTRVGPNEEGKKNDSTKRHETIDLCEIRDKKRGTVFIVAPQVTNEVILFDTDPVQANGRLGYYFQVFNPDDEYCWGLPDSQILEPIQLEMNETKTQIMRHRRLTLIKLLVQKNMMDPEEAAKMVDESVLPVIWTNDNPNQVVMKLEAAGVPPELFTVLEDLWRDSREIVGFSRNEAGDSLKQLSGDVSATEVNRVAQATDFRLDERRDGMIDMLLEIVEDLMHIIFSQWTEEIILDVTGPNMAPVWVRFRPSMLRNIKFKVSIDPDTAVPKTAEQKAANALRAYQLLFGVNPMVDPHQLTSNLLRQLGIEFESMLVGIPPNAGREATDPLSVQDLAAQLIAAPQPSPPQGGAATPAQEAA